MLIAKYGTIASLIMGALLSLLHFVSHSWVGLEAAALETYRSSRLYRYVSLIENDGAPPLAVETMLSEAAAKYSLPVPILHGLMVTESRANTEAYSPKGAIGLMQIMPENAKRCGVKPSKLWDERTNIFCGAQILSEELATYGNDLRRALLSYNGGPRCVKSSCSESVTHAARVMAAASIHLIENR